MHTCPGSQLVGKKWKRQAKWKKHPVHHSSFFACALVFHPILNDNNRLELRVILDDLVGVDVRKCAVSSIPRRRYVRAKRRLGGIAAKAVCAVYMARVSLLADWIGCMGFGG
ncbi:uncharacterized protein EI97DRAFT_431322 [Westerdykella ornata]|uniref:Uncharacterized protein n=1 Tax=Westerdykella ornata TaxID=318751 RepID=A0A6A6JRU4_WESOR|nr:uncharacterized protein EI97DRAFT_431322 [Westerdykella ornata]KAF2279107.1 hypothetical protein EI97DRAFT_431322 [Westerdykella ornata]